MRENPDGFPSSPGASRAAALYPVYRLACLRNSCSQRRLRAVSTKSWPGGPGQPCRARGRWATRPGAGSGGVWPDVRHAGDDGVRLSAGLQVVDVGLSAEDGGVAGVTSLRDSASALTLVPDVTGSQEGRLSTTFLELADFSSGGVHGICVVPALGVSDLINDLAAGGGGFGPDPIHAWKK